VAGEGDGDTGGVGDAAGVGVGVSLLPVLPAEFPAEVPVAAGGEVSVVAGGGVTGADDCAGGVVLGVLLGELVDGDGVGDVPVELEELLGVGGGLLVLSVSHCQIVGLEVTFPVTTPDPTLGDAARACGATEAATANPAAAVSKTPPAMRPIATGRTRAKHM
jgi:hypothetical protein